jgi:anti-sigma factor RsiW
MPKNDDLSCVELVELVTDYLEGVLPPTERSRFEAHLADCDGCVNYIDQMRTTIEVTGRLRVDDLSAEVQADLVSAFRAWHENSPG